MAGIVGGRIEGGRQSTSVMRGMFVLGPMMETYLYVGTLQSNSKRKNKSRTQLMNLFLKLGYLSRFSGF